MAVVDLVNDIAPKHPYRPVVSPSMEVLRDTIEAADSGDVYTRAYLDKCNRNDLVAIARHLDVELAPAS